MNLQLDARFTCEPIGQYIRIQTPFLYPDGDVIDVFYRDGLFTDGGETLGWFKMQTIEFRLSLDQRQQIQKICQERNVVFERGTFTMTGANDHMQQSIDIFLECLLLVVDELIEKR
jgi:hypothetical protein